MFSTSSERFWKKVRKKSRATSTESGILNEVEAAGYVMVAKELQCSSGKRTGGVELTDAKRVAF